MTNRELADRLEALVSDLRYNDCRINNLRVANFVRFNDVAILTALRAPTYAEGAEAMRELAECKAAEAISRLEKRLEPIAGYDAQRAKQEARGEMMNLQSAIRALPLPEPKP